MKIDWKTIIIYKETNQILVQSACEWFCNVWTIDNENNISMPLWFVWLTDKQKEKIAILDKLGRRPVNVDTKQKKIIRLQKEIDIIVDSIINWWKEYSNTDLLASISMLLHDIEITK